MQIKMNDLCEALQALSGADEEGGKLFLTNLNKVRGVGAVVASDDEQHVHGLAQHVEQGVLSLLSGTANGVEYLEILLSCFVTIAINDGLLHAAL